MPSKPRGPHCGHSACSQHFIDTGLTYCGEGDNRRLLDFVETVARLQTDDQTAGGMNAEDAIATVNSLIEQARALTQPDDAEEPVAALRPGVFTFDGSDEYPGWHTGALRNGFLTPLFTPEVFLTICEDLELGARRLDATTIEVDASHDADPARPTLVRFTPEPAAGGLALGCIEGWWWLSADDGAAPSSSPANVPAPMPLEIHRTLTLSSAHIDPKETPQLDFHASMSCEHGWLLHVGRTIELAAVPSIANVIAFATRNNCEFIRIDADGPTADELPTYEW